MDGQTYLLHSSLELNETAYLLGYEDANSFFRVFHQREGTSPGTVGSRAYGFRLANLSYQASPGLFNIRPAGATSLAIDPLR
jgi:AraC-like DNA-binding protein